jgi:hypothetical protein
MKYLLALGVAIAATLVLLVDPTPEPPMETVDTVAECVLRYWPGKPIDKWMPAEGMDPVCKAIMNRAREVDR